MKVLKDRVLIKQDDPEKLVGRAKIIYAPDSAKKEFPNMGTVLAVGSTVVDVKVGDRVIYQRKPETSLDPDCNPNNEHYNLLSLPEANILAVIDE